MIRHKLTIAYLGTAFHGWQAQKTGLLTVQQAIESVLATVYRSEIPIFAAGRTDTGVHADGQVIHCDLPKEMSESMRQRLNKMLYPHAAIRSAVPVHEHFHARFDATWRRYRYDIILDTNPLLDATSWLIVSPFDQKLFSEALHLFRGIHDFAGFSKFDPQQAHTLCEVQHIELTELSQFHLRIHIQANRFLRNMVRRIIGASADVARNKIPMDVIAATLHSKKAESPLFTAPAKGLVLEAVGYE